MAEPDGSIEKVRTVFERALMAAGLHVPKGALLWESYREFENIVLAGLVSTQYNFSMVLFLYSCINAVVLLMSNTDLFCTFQMSNCDGENPSLADQLKRVANLFKRQLSVPLFNMEKTYAAFEEWLEENKPLWTTASGKPESALVEKNNVDLAYKKALDRLHQIQSYEDILVFIFNLYVLSFS